MKRKFVFTSNYRFLKFVKLKLIESWLNKFLRGWLQETSVWLEFTYNWNEWKVSFYYEIENRNQPTRYVLPKSQCNCSISKNSWRKPILSRCFWFNECFEFRCNPILSWNYRAEAKWRLEPVSHQQIDQRCLRKEIGGQISSPIQAASEFR